MAWSTALVKVAVEDKAENADVLAGWIGQAAPSAFEAVLDAMGPLTKEPEQPSDVTAVRRTIAQACTTVVQGAGLTAPAQLE